MPASRFWFLIQSIALMLKWREIWVLLVDSLNRLNALLTKVGLQFLKKWYWIQCQGRDQSNLIFKLKIMCRLHSRSLCSLYKQELLFLKRVQTLRKVRLPKSSSLQVFKCANPTSSHFPCLLVISLAWLRADMPCNEVLQARMSHLLIFSSRWTIQIYDNILWLYMNDL